MVSVRFYFSRGQIELRYYGEFRCRKSLRPHTEYSGDRIQTIVFCIIIQRFIVTTQLYTHLRSHGAPAPHTDSVQCTVSILEDKGVVYCKKDVQLLDTYACNFTVALSQTNYALDTIYILGRFNRIASRQNISLTHLIRPSKQKCRLAGTPKREQRHLA